MFSWFRKKPTQSKESMPPQPLKASPRSNHSEDGALADPAKDMETCEANAGRGVSMHATFTHEGRTWKESANLVECLDHALKECGHTGAIHKGHVRLENGLIMHPRVAHFAALDEGGARTVTTVETSLPGRIPPAIFEYQHSSGKTVVESITSGLKNWAQLDLPAFLESLEESPKNCITIGPGKVESETPAEIYRRIILGPVARFAQDPDKHEEGEHPPFCLCCLFSHSIQAFDSLLKKSEYFGVRLYAMRDQNGEFGADCRVNGLDWPEGMEALKAYAATWPGQGVEFRKQYIVIQTPERKPA